MEPLTSSDRERQKPLEKAIEMIDLEAKHLGWSFNESRIGIYFPTVYSEILSSLGNVIQEGMGKGLGRQALASARFEALEHSITDLSTNLMQGIWKGSLNDANLLKFKLLPESLPKLLIENPGLYNQNGYWKVFKSSFNDQTYIYPLSKLDPFSNYEDLYKDEIYKTAKKLGQPWFRNNNGSAIGTTTSDALLHAYNETIERYSICCLYVDSYLKSNASPIKIVDSKTLPDNILNLFEKIEFENNVTLTVIDMTCELKVPSFAVRSSSNTDQKYTIGYGTSIYSDYAIERALLECQQLIHTQSHPTFAEINDEERITAEKRLTEWPSLLSAITLNPDHAEIELVRFQESLRSFLSVDKQLAELEKKFTDHQIEVFTSITYNSSISTLSAVRVIIPEFSDFSFIAAGLAVVPSGRVLERLKED